jgi:subtilisin family serine protease
MVRRGKSLALLLALVIGALATGAAWADNTEKVLIRAGRPYTQLRAQIAGLGGRVTHEYKYVDAVAAEVPAGALAALAGMVGDSAISKDVVIANPAPVNTLAGRPGFSSRGPIEEESYASVAEIGAAELQRIASANPDAYSINNGIMGTSVLHARGRAGQGVIVGVIDSGIRPGFPHIELDGSVVGCEDFVGDANGCSHAGNDGHGTFVAGMISANVVFTFSTTSSFRNAVLANCPGCFSNPPTNTQIPMIGSAPLSSIYAFRVFPPTGGAPTSRILVAVERLIELKEKFDAGQPGGVNIQVANMSLGGPTLFAGFDLFDREVAVMILKGIVPVVSAGNAGPSSLTVGSPGTSLGVITVGAASLAHNERILRDLQFGVGIGSLYRPFEATQTAYFSSRGPNANGFPDPDVTANGFASYGQGYLSTTSIIIGSGTSFSAPSVAGVAALLRQAFPKAPPWKIRNAILAGANPGILQDGSTELDQGHGFVDAFAAYNRLAAGRVPLIVDRYRPPTHSVAENVRQGTDLRVRHGIVEKHVKRLLPSEREDILYEVTPNTRKVFVTLAGFEAELPPAGQNQLFGDDILLTVHSAKTSAIGEGDYKVFSFTVGGTFTIEDPEPGLLRITVNGDWTNAGRVSADVLISPTLDALPGVTAHAKLREGETAVFPIEVPPGVGEAEFRLAWENDWSQYPSSDLDMIIFDPSFSANQDGASLDSPEAVTITNPTTGTWYVLVTGFEVNAWKERFKLRVALDGNVVH